MREIRFRARNANVPHCWIYGYFVIEEDYCYIINDDGKFKVIADTQGQYAGRKDNLGKEIYEGDRIKYFTSYEREDDYRDGITIVEWDEDCAGFYPFILNIKWRCDVKGVEIIGNIYENPERLENKDA